MSRCRDVLATLTAAMLAATGAMAEPLGLGREATPAEAAAAMQQERDQGDEGDAGQGRVQMPRSGGDAGQGLGKGEAKAAIEPDPCHTTENGPERETVP